MELAANLDDAREPGIERVVGRLERDDQQTACSVAR